MIIISEYLILGWVIIGFSCKPSHKEQELTSLVCTAATNIFLKTWLLGTTLSTASFVCLSVLLVVIPTLAVFFDTDKASFVWLSLMAVIGTLSLSNQLIAALVGLKVISLFLVFTVLTGVVTSTQAEKYPFVQNFLLSNYVLLVGVAFVAVTTWLSTGNLHQRISNHLPISKFTCIGFFVLVCAVLGLGPVTQFKKKFYRGLSYHHIFTYTSTYLLIYILGVLPWVPSTQTISSFYFIWPAVILLLVSTLKDTSSTKEFLMLSSAITATYIILTVVTAVC